MFDYDKALSKRAVELPKSGIRMFFDLVTEMKDVISLTIGQPDFVTPWHIRSAGMQSLQEGRTYYTGNAGVQPLRQEISKYLARRLNLTYDESEIVVTVGGSEAIDMAIRSIVNPGDEVIIPTPSFVCYAPLTQLASGVPVIVKTEEADGFRLTPKKLLSAITDKTKLLVLPFPGNPSGAVMRREDLEAVADILRGTNITVLSDEIYAELTYPHPHCSIAHIEDMRERTIVASGLSKAYAMTGWRIGYTAAPKPFTQQLSKVHQYGTMCAPTTSQYAAIEAFKNGDEDIETMKAEYNRRRLFLVNGLHEAGIPCFEPQGAFYVFPNISHFGLSSSEFCTRLLYDQRVALVPGTAFGECGEGFVRISYAYSLDHLKQALQRISVFTEKLKSEKGANGNN